MSFTASGEVFSSVNASTAETLTGVSSVKEYLSDSYYVNGDNEIVDVDPTLGPGLK